MNIGGNVRAFCKLYYKGAFVLNVGIYFAMRTCLQKKRGLVYGRRNFLNMFNKSK